MSDYRQQYNRQISKLALLLLGLHLPVFAFMAYWFKTEYSVALGLSTFILLGPLVSFFRSQTHKPTLILSAFALISFSAIMIHLGRGMIEFHFHIFVMLALLALTGSMVPVLTGAATAAVHHIAFFFLFPKSIFNYEASFGIVLLHATFVIIETVGCLYLAKRFGDVLELQGSTAVSLKDVVDRHIELSSELNQSSQDLTTTNNAQINVTKSALEALRNISGVANTNSDLAEKSLAQTQLSFDSLELSQGQLSSISSSMADIQKTQNDVVSYMNESSDQMHTFLKAVQEISAKTKVINEIVFQTKLLSFNASVEAARAGEAGKGFSVVAEEVGNLASMSGKAAKEIEKLLNNSVNLITKVTQDLTAKSSSISKMSTHKIESGLSVSNEAITSIMQTVTSAKQIKQLMQQIFEGTQIQKNGVEKLTEAVSQLDEVSVQSGDIASNNRAQAQKLIADTGALKILVDSINNKAS